MKNAILSVLCLVILSTSCSKDEAKSETSTNPSTVNVKYEIIASSDVRTSNGVNNPQISITYTNSAGQQQIETMNYPNNFRTWNKTFNLTNTNRPLQLRLNMSNLTPITYNFTIQNGGTVKMNLYLDGVLTKSETRTSDSSYLPGTNWYNIAIFDLAYTVQ